MPKTHLAKLSGEDSRQYVILGAGLDTFAYRNPYTQARLRVFEVDHPTTQSWKRARLEEAGISVPASLTFVPVDFETQTMADGLRQATFDHGEPAFFSWLGVTPYLTGEAIASTLKFIAAPEGRKRRCLRLRYFTFTAESPAAVGIR